MDLYTYFEVKITFRSIQDIDPPKQKHLCLTRLFVSYDQKLISRGMTQAVGSNSSWFESYYWIVRLDHVYLTAVSRRVIELWLLNF